jgi:hypothetical protein
MPSDREQQSVVHNCKSAPCYVCGSEDGSGNPLPDDIEGENEPLLLDGWSESSYFRYQREHLTLRLTIRNMTNHEMRELMIGLWSRLDSDDRKDHIRELVHYSTDPEAFLSGIAQQIRSA